MKQIFFNGVISDIEVVSDTEVQSGELTPGWVGVVAEVVRDEFEGTLVYFPGVHAKELLP